MIEITCTVCGRPYTVYPGQAAKSKFCGNDCKFAYQKLHPTRPRKPRVTVPCATCGQPVSFLPSQRGSYRKDRGDNIYCSRECKGVGHSKTMTGRRPSNGVYASHATFRSMIRLDFVDRCAICGWDEAPCDVAHIVSRRDGGEDTLENVVMLCPNHHRLFDLGKIPADQVRHARLNILRSG